MVTQYINPDHEGYYYDPIEGRLFIVKEVKIVDEDADGKVRSRRRTFKGMHRLCTHIIYFIMTGDWLPENHVIDHKDNDPWNNKWNNFRPATREQNAHNRQPPGRPVNDNLGLEMGVEITPEGKYRVKVAGIHVGNFETVGEANAAVAGARQVLYGEFDYNNNRGI